MGLKAPGLRALHFFPDPLNRAGIHAVAGKRAFLEEFLAALPVGQVINDLVEAGRGLWLVDVTDGFDQQVAQALIAEDLAEDVENAAAEGLAFLLNLLEQAFVDVAFAGFFGQRSEE